MASMTLSIRRLEPILEAIRRELPGVRRVSSYCLPRNLQKKSVEELKRLADLGLSLVYVGAESGDDDVLARVNKGETLESAREALDKLQQAGIKRSVMNVNDCKDRGKNRCNPGISGHVWKTYLPEPPIMVSE